MSEGVDELMLGPLPPTGRRAALEQALRERIRSGQLAPGAALPSTRRLANELGVTRRLVVEAFEQLAAEGYIVSVHGSGTRVGNVAPSSPATRLTAETEPETRFDFRPGTPDVTLFPMGRWARMLADACNDPNALAYGDPCGHPELRVALADWLGRVRGTNMTPEAIVVFAGMASGISLWARILRSRGVLRVAVEDPGSDGFRRQLVAAGVEPVPISVDDAGIDVEELCRQDNLGGVVVTPAHQFPWGSVLSPERRTALLDWARTNSVQVFEDDYDAEFRYDRAPIGSLQGAAPDVVTSAGSASKSLAPGLRLGWLAVPPSMLEEMAHARPSVDLGQPGPDQLAFARFISEGHHDRQLRKVRTVYRARRDELVSALSDLPHVEVRGIAAGLHAVLTFPEGTIAVDRVLAQATTEHVGLVPLSNYRVRDIGPAGIVVGYGAIPQARWPAALSALVRCVSR